MAAYRRAHLNNMADTNQSPFIELSDYWRSITRKVLRALDGVYHFRLERPLTF